MTYMCMYHSMACAECRTFSAPLAVKESGEKCAALPQPVSQGSQPHDPFRRRPGQVSLALGQPGQCPSSIQHVCHRQHQPDDAAPYDSSGQGWQR